jgi:thiol-disulfide isomerase/thioredoxin
MHKSIPLFLFSILLASCQAQDAPVQEEPPKVEAASTDPVDSVPLYETFDELAPIFEQKNDTTYLINFWATWCKPCVEEMPYIEQLHDDFGDQKLAIILVSLDFPKQIESKLLPFIRENQLRSRVVALLDGKYNDWIDRVDPSWGGAIPVTVIYNAEKRVFIDKPIKQYEDIKAIVASFF